MKSKIAFAAGLTAGVLVVMSATLIAGQVNGLINFTGGTPALAAEVNGNFTAVKTAVDDNDARIAALEALLAGVTRTSLNGQPTVQFSGVNLQIVSGAGSTTAPPNARGNLILGYDEPRNDTKFFCSIGTEGNGTPIPPSTSPTPPAACTDAGGTWAVSHKSGSHYLVMGTQNNYSQSVGIVVGQLNTSNNFNASVSGGLNNNASGSNASVSGGAGNTASGSFASVSGGGGNSASGHSASVSGGQQNVASGSAASVSGGVSNRATDGFASVSGGENNTASFQSASVSGGGSNVASGFRASVSGGAGNTASGNAASVSGGSSNTASGSSASVSGGRGCNFGATSGKWVVGDAATNGCNTTHQN